MTLADIHRQVRHQLRKVRILAVRARPDGATDVADHLLHAVLDTGAGLLRPWLGIGQRLLIHLPGTRAQNAGRAVQCTVHRAQVGEGMGLRALRAERTQRFSQALRGAVPAGGDADPSLPETGAREVIPRPADCHACGATEHNFHCLWPPCPQRASRRPSL